jgi:cytochrome b involved in lipid metabolism
MSSQLLPKQHGRRRRYYTPEEINAHNSADDAWFSLFHNVFDLTELIATHRSSLTQPLISNAGRDISHWFDGKTMMVKSYYSEDKGVMLPYVPMGRFLNV